jgi:hypothetical protein
LAATNYYCTTQDVINRLSQAGVLYAADPTGQGTINDAIVQTILTNGLVEAGRQIDRALQPTWIGSLPLTQDDQSLNPHLRGWAVKLASLYVATNAGHGVPQALKDDYSEARADLDRVQTKKLRIPGLVYPGDGWMALRRGQGRPRVANGEKFHPGNLDDPWRDRGFGGPWNG